jgi:uncharacterized protein (DUF885 family)
MSKNYDYNFVIVEMSTVHVYDFMVKGETVAEAEVRGNKYYQDELEHVKSHLKNYGGEYWEDQVKAITKQVKTGCKLMSYEQFKEAERKHLLNGELTEVTADQFDDALNVLPPICWTTHNNVEMFCMCEMYTGSYTSQYAHDKRTGKYYTKLVDCKDRSTWICELLTA